jgi:hypothetical protein
MKHVKRISVAKAATSKQFDDPAGAIFFQVWLSVFTTILAGAFGFKD